MQVLLKTTGNEESIEVIENAIGVIRINDYDVMIAFKNENGEDDNKLFRLDGYREIIVR